MSNTKSTFIMHGAAEKRIASAKTAIRVLLSAKLYESHLTELLKICIWKLSLAECRSKYKTRYRSIASRGQPREKLNHDHVFETSKLARELRAQPQRIETIAKKALGCVVTREEHRRLTTLSKSRPELHGWARYRKEGIRVIDTKTGKNVPAAGPTADNR